MRSDIEAGSPAGAAAALAARASQLAAAQPAFPQQGFPQQGPSQSAPAQPAWAQPAPAQPALAPQGPVHQQGHDQPALAQPALSPPTTVQAAVAQAVAAQAAAQLFAAADQVGTGAGGLFSDGGPNGVVEQPIRQRAETVAAPDRQGRPVDDPSAVPRPDPVVAAPFGGPQPFPGAQHPGATDVAAHRPSGGPLDAADGSVPAFPMHPAAGRWPFADDHLAPHEPGGGRASEVPADPGPDDRSGTDAGFMALLERRLDEAPDVELPPAIEFPPAIESAGKAAPPPTDRPGHRPDPRPHAHEPIGR